MLQEKPAKETENEEVVKSVREQGMCPVLKLKGEFQEERKKQCPLPQRV